MKFCFCDIISDNMMGNELSPTVKIFSHLSFNLKSSTFYEDKRAKLFVESSFNSPFKACELTPSPGALHSVALKCFEFPCINYMLVRVRELYNRRLI